MLFGKKPDKKKKTLPPDPGLDMDTESISADSVVVQRGISAGYEEETVRNAAPGRAKVMSISIKDRKTLHAAYMPFVSSGGIFVPSSSQYKIGEEVFLLLKLVDSPEQISISGQIVWFTPEGAQSSRQSGIGIQFTGPEANQVRSKIEGILGGALKSRRMTHTM
ncbi:MAG: type IV pilus assembly protein PilZ [Parasphingorhabdus sp.]